jgi:hypothetical protein
MTFLLLIFQKMQKQFIKYLKAKTQDNTSFVEEIASVLDIGYDAAYRRINNKTNLSLEESVILAKHYKISLNKLFEVGSQSTILTEISPRIFDEDSLEDFFKTSANNVAPLIKIKNAEIIYSAKDIPFFYTLQDTYLTRYKIYVWLKDVNVNMIKSKITFDDFIKTIPDSLLQSAFSLGDIYKYINISEMWNDSTILGTLQQILYYFNSGLLSKELALVICDDMEEIINHVEKQTIQQSILNSKNKASYHLYKNDLHTMSNTIFVKTPYQMAFFQPYMVLTYFEVEHQPTCELMYEFLRKQMANSKLLANTGERDRTLFFSQMLNKLNIVRERIKVGLELSFF